MSPDTSNLAIQAVQLGLVSEEAAWFSVQAAMVPDRNGRLATKARGLLRSLRVLLDEMDKDATGQLDRLTEMLLPTFQRFGDPYTEDYMCSELAHCGDDPDAKPGIAYFEEVAPSWFPERLSKICTMALKGRESEGLIRLGALVRRLICPPDALRDMVVALPRPESTRPGRPLRRRQAVPPVDWRLRTWNVGRYKTDLGIIDEIRDCWAGLALGSMPDLRDINTENARRRLCVETIRMISSRLPLGRRNPVVWETYGPWSFSPNAARFRGTVVLEFNRQEKGLALLRALADLGTDANQRKLLQTLACSADDLRHYKMRLIDKLAQVPEFEHMPKFFDEVVFRLVPELLDTVS